MFDKRISIFVGHYGSGKSEVSVNYAMRWAEAGNKTAIVDMDIVNPYFRSTDAKSVLEYKGIRVISTVYANTNVDVPALPGEISGLFEDKSYNVVLDVGGDDAGAAALGRYRDKIAADDYDIFFIVNINRPMTNTYEKVIGIIREIEASSRLKVTKLVNNSNLLNLTDYNDILRGRDVVRKVSETTGIPIGFSSVMKEYYDCKLEISMKPILIMDKHINLPFTI